jgi:uncharacterized delta-60 repeat protein
VLTGGTTDGDPWHVLRVLADGTPDPAFGGGDGKVFEFLGAGATATDLVLQPDGKIVVVGGDGSGMVVARHMPDGGLDSSFSGDGYDVVSFGDGYEMGYAVALQPDGKVVVAGQAGGTLSLARYRADGTLDDGFGATAGWCTPWASSRARGT